METGHRRAVAAGAAAGEGYSSNHSLRVKLSK